MAGKSLSGTISAVNKYILGFMPCDFRTRGEKV